MFRGVRQQMVNSKWTFSSSKRVEIVIWVTAPSRGRGYNGFAERMVKAFLMGR
jgi:hypothetical protein